MKVHKATSKECGHGDMVECYFCGKPFKIINVATQYLGIYVDKDIYAWVCKSCSKIPSAN